MDSPWQAPLATRTNLILAGFFVTVHILGLIVLPVAGLAPVCSAITLSAFVLGTPAHWALVHDAIHGQLLRSRAANNRLGRALAILFGVPFRAVRFAHLRHHRYNRSPWGREEMFDPRTRSPVTAYCLHYLRITFGLYLGELAVSFLCWLPRSFLQPRLRRLCPDLQDGTGMAHLVDRELLSAGAITQIRSDALCVIALYGTAFACYGRHWPLLAACLAARAFIISQLDHAPHHDTPLDQREHALNLSAPRWLQGAVLGFNLHRTHHQHPNLPWAALLRTNDFRAEDISLVRAVLRQWRGPVALPDMPGVRPSA